MAVLAGQPGGGGSADGIGAQARFNAPLVLLADGAGIVYATDATTVRRLDTTTGQVSILAGSLADPWEPVLGGPPIRDGVGRSASFSFPSGLALDGMGNLFVADATTLREIALATGQVTTVAGDPDLANSMSGDVDVDGIGLAARLVPGGMAFDASAGIIYFVDGGLTIRSFALASRTVSTLAGQPGVSGSADGFGGDARFASPSDIALAGGSLYVVDSGNYDIRRMDLSSRYVTTIAGCAMCFGSDNGVGSMARFFDPGGIVFASGALYVTDTGNSTIRRIDPLTRAVTTIAGMPQEIGAADGFGSAALFNWPIGIAAGSGELYVADTHNDTIRRLDLSSAQVTTVAAAASSADIVDGPSADASFAGPTGLAEDDAGNLFVADYGGNTIREIGSGPGRPVTTLAGTEGTTGSSDGVGAAIAFDGPDGLAIAGNYLYVADSQNDTIRRIDLTTHASATIAGTPGVADLGDGFGSGSNFSVPAGLAIQGGTLYVADKYNSAVRAIDLATGGVRTVAGGPAQTASCDSGLISFPEGVAADANGHLYVANRGCLTVDSVDLSTERVLTIAGQPGLSGSVDGPRNRARFIAPVDVALDGTGGLFVVDAGVTVRWIDLSTGGVATVVGTPGRWGVLPGCLPGSLNWPGRVLFAHGTLLITDGIENCVLSVE